MRCLLRAASHASSEAEASGSVEAGSWAPDSVAARTPDQDHRQPCMHTEPWQLLADLPGYVEAMRLHLCRQVCGGLGVDMWDVLQPLRQARPVNGGSAVDHDLVMSLRMLNFQLD